MACLEFLLVAGVHFGVRSDIHRPSVSAIAGEINTTDAAIEIPTGSPSIFRGDEDEFADRPWPITRAATPGLAAVGGDVNPAFDVRSNLTTAYPSQGVISEENRSVKHLVNGRTAFPLRAAIRTAAEVDARSSGVQI